METGIHAGHQVGGYGHHNDVPSTILVREEEDDYQTSNNGHHAQLETRSHCNAEKQLLSWGSKHISCQKLPF